MIVLLLEIDISSEFFFFFGGYYRLLRQWDFKFWLQEQRELPWNLRGKPAEPFNGFAQSFISYFCNMKSLFSFFAVMDIFFLMFFCMANREHIFQTWKPCAQVLLISFSFFISFIRCNILHVNFSYVIKLS